jgi:hypothetical protein
MGTRGRVRGVEVVHGYHDKSCSPGHKTNSRAGCSLCHTWTTSPGMNSRDEYGDSSYNLSPAPPLRPSLNPERTGHVTDQKWEVGETTVHET